MFSTCACASDVQFFHIPTWSDPYSSAFWHFNLQMCFSLQRRAIFATSRLPKVVRTPQLFDILTCNRASRYSGAPILRVRSSKSGPELMCFVHFDLRTCFSLQRRANFARRNFKKRSGADVFCTFWLEHVLLATAAHKFCASELPKAVRPWGVLYILTWKCASRYSGVQFFIPPLNSYLRTRRFTKPAFRPSRPTNHWKNAAFRDFPNSSRVCIFFLLTFAHMYLLSSDSTSLLCFSSSDPASLLCFFNCPSCRKLDF